MNFDILDFERVVPKSLLEFYLDKLDIEADRRSYQTMYDGLSEDNSTLLDDIYTKYKYAGRTAVNIFEEITLPSGFLTKDRLEGLLRLELGTDDIYQEFRPPLSEYPQINFVKDLENRILIQFVSKGKERRVRDGYEIRTITSINFELAIVHFTGRTTIELRCAYNAHGKFLTCFENYFRLIPEFSQQKFEWVPITRVSNKEAEKIAAILSAGLIEADHKDDGIYDRHIVTASPRVRDLRQEAEYVQQFKNKMLLSQTLVIKYLDKTPLGNFASDIKFRINLFTGFQFQSKVSEHVIDYVMRVFLDVRYNQT